LGSTAGKQNTVERETLERTPVHPNREGPEEKWLAGTEKNLERKKNGNRNQEGKGMKDRLN